MGIDPEFWNFFIDFSQDSAVAFFEALVLNLDSRCIISRILSIIYSVILLLTLPGFLLEIYTCIPLGFLSRILLVHQGSFQRFHYRFLLGFLLGFSRDSLRNFFRVSIRHSYIDTSLHFVVHFYVFF